jgi:mono/diheme cytochrome c family protein
MEAIRQAGDEAGRGQRKTRSSSRARTGRWAALACATVIGTLGLVAACGDDDRTGPRPLDPTLVAEGKTIFRFDTFGDETFWTDTLRMHEVIRTGVSPATALSVGLKVDADTLPQAVKDALAAGQVDLNDPATTVTLLKLGAVVGLVGEVDANDNLVRVGTTCALCHSTVDNSFAPGIGRRLDGWPNRDLNPGAIIALSPALTAAQKAVYNSWGPGMYDPRFNFDGINQPVVLPPAFGLREVRRELYTGDDSVSYWNAYVAITQMHGHGRFVDPRLGINIDNTPPDRVTTPILAALAEYQFSLDAPAARAGDFDAAAAARGRVVFTGAGQCSTCHTGALLTDINAGTLHAPSEVASEPEPNGAPSYAQRSVTKMYRTTPLRGLYNPPQLQGPYFHNGVAETLEEVVDRYVAKRSLNLTAQEKADLVQYLRSL